jgi:hypothetical protein
MQAILSEKRFDSLSAENESFILAFDREIKDLGYEFGGSIGDGYCWGKYMIIYSKKGVKGKQVAARIYMRESSIVLRLYLNKIDGHRAYIESAESFIKEVFTGKHADCKRCHNDKGGICKFRKEYTIDGRHYEKCNGITFEFSDPNLEKLPDYMNLLKEFYRTKKRAG